MPRMPRGWARFLGYLLLAGSALAVGAELARPFQSASIAFDSQAAVLYFERIVSGSHLEAFVPTTPKPLLTVVFGVLHSLTHDWRTLAWATLGTNALAVALTAALAHRMGGAMAAAFVGVALVNNASLLFDVGYALATPYALLGWAIAGLAITAPRPRYGVAGLGLAFATLARVETLVVIGVALVAIGWAAWGPRRFRVATPSKSTWLVPMVGLLALPIMFAHDALLTGDPLYWTGVAARYAAQTTAHIPTSFEVVRELVDRYWSMGALTLLAGLGAVRLVGERRYGLLVGLVALGPAIAAFLVFLAARQIYVPIRYTAAVDVAVIFAAGLGIGALSVAALHWPPLDRFAAYAGERAGSAATVAVVAVVALLLAGPYWQTNPSLRSTVRASLHLAIDADRALPVLAAELARTGRPTGSVAVLVPGPIRPRLVVDLGLPLTAVGGTAAAKVDVAGGYPAAGQLVLHDRAGDAAAPGWADLEIEEPRTVGSVVLEPLLADSTSGVWVIAVR